MLDTKMPLTQKIGFFCSSLAWGGLEINVFRLQKWLSEQSLKVVLLAQEKSRLYQESLKMQLPVVAVEAHWRYFDFYQAYRLANILKKENIEILFIFHMHDSDIVAWIKRFFLPRLIIIYQQHMQITTNKKDILHDFRYSTYHAWISPSEFLVQQLQQFTNVPEKKIHIIPLGVEVSQFVENKVSQKEALAFFDIPYEEDFTYLGIIGRIDPQKGQLFVVKALKNLLQENDRLKLLIVGDKTQGSEADEYFQEIQQFVRTNHLENVVYFRSFTTQVEKFYQAIDIFVLASLGETYGMVTIEAMLSRKIILATDSGGTPHILQQGRYGTLYQPENEKDFIEKLKKILADRTSFLEKALQAEKHALSYYSHQNECKQLVEMLSRLVQTNQEKKP